MSPVAAELRCSSIGKPNLVELLSPVLARAQVAKGLVGTRRVVPFDPPAHDTRCHSGSPE